MDFTLYARCDATERAARIPSLTFPDILCDPLVRLVMKADGVDPKELERELWDIAALLPEAQNRNPRKARNPVSC